MIQEKLKNYVKHSPRLECLYMCLNALGNQELAKQIVGIKRNPYNLIMRRNGNLLPDKNIYSILFDKGYEVNGFCSLFRFVLSHLAFSEDINMIPYVSWGKNTLYYDETINWTNNVFDYYFETVSEVSLNDVLSCAHVVISKGADASAFGTTNGYNISNEEIKKMGKYVCKYIKLKPEIENQINKDFYTKGRTLGVHVRATDFNKGYNRHPIVVTPIEYLEHVKIVFEEKKFDNVFLATDDYHVVELFKSELGDRLFYYDGTYRSINGEAIHYNNESINREHHKYKLGLEILKDFYTLGRCDGLIAGKSNVSMCAQIIKESQSSPYLYLEIIDKGVNHNMHESRSKFNPMIKNEKRNMDR